MNLSASDGAFQEWGPPILGVAKWVLVCETFQYQPSLIRVEGVPHCIAVA